MEMEIEELRRQRDLAESQVDELRKKLQDDQQQVSISPSLLPSFILFSLISVYSFALLFST